jgi:hypothetical protein
MPAGFRSLATICGIVDHGHQFRSPAGRISSGSNRMAMASGHEFGLA